MGADHFDEQVTTESRFWNGSASCWLVALAFCLITLALTGCGPAPTSKADLDGMSQSLSYFKDRYNVCYAVASSITAQGYTVRSIASVPCEQVKL